MKVLLLLIAVVAFAIAKNDRNDLEEVKAVLKCLDILIRKGLPTAGIPPHDPLSIENFSFPLDIKLIKYQVSLNNTILYNLLDYNFTTLNATSYVNPGRVNYDYDLYWPKLHFTGDYYWSYKVALLPETTGQGTFDIVLRHTDFVGIFNLTKPGQVGVQAHVDNFTLDIKVKDIDVKLTNASTVVEFAVKEGLLVALNHVPKSAGDFLKEKRFNEYWIAHPERIQAVIDFCQANSPIL